MRTTRLFGIGTMLFCLLACNSTSAGSQNTASTNGTNNSETIASGQLRDTVFSLVSSAENSSLDYRAQYAYIEDIGDGRGYTAGIIGFTSGTGDLLFVIQKYAALKPAENVLAKYLDALEVVNGTDSHEGLGDAFVSAWKTACADDEMFAAQDAILDELYMTPAVSTAQADGLSPLGQYVYYDALVVHGPGDDADSFGGIRKSALKKATTPAQGGDETEYLTAFLDARKIIMKKEAAHSDLSRLNAQKKFISEKKLVSLTPACMDDVRR